MREFWGDSTWFSGAGISRRQQSIKEELQKIDRQVIANGENHKNIKEPYGGEGGKSGKFCRDTTKTFQPRSLLP